MSADDPKVKSIGNAKRVKSFSVYLLPNFIGSVPGCRVEIPQVDFVIVETN